MRWWPSSFAAVCARPTRPCFDAEYDACRGHRLQPGDGADDGDRAAVTGLEHRRDRGLQRLPGADEVDVDDVGELFLGQLPHLAPPGEHARIGDHVVQPSELFDGIRDELLLEAQVARISLPRKDLTPDALDEPDGLGEVLGRWRADRSRGR